VSIFEGKEPLQFIVNFLGWDKKISSEHILQDTEESLHQYSKTFSVEELKNRDELPSWVDKTKLEAYLSEEDFDKLFGMSRHAYETLPNWKKPDVKKKTGLF